MNLDITFPKTPCSILSLDIVDITGVHMTNIGGSLEKRMLDSNGVVLHKYDALAASANGN